MTNPFISGITGWLVGTLLVFTAALEFTLGNHSGALDVASGFGYLLAGVLAMPGTRGVVSDRLFGGGLTGEVALRWIFLFVALGVGLQFWAAQVSVPKH